MHFGIKTGDAWGKMFRVYQKTDIQLAVFSFFAIVSYCAFALGTCSPIHCRFTATFVGLICVMLCVQGGAGLCYVLDYGVTELHDTLPVLMLGIGVDDMFVICNALDQSSLKLTPEERIRQAISHAGPSITITSFTNALAFLSGALSTIPAVRSFCVFAFVCICFLYITVLTVFTPFIYWDTKRVYRRNREAFGLMCCAEDSRLFCRGRMLSEP